MVAEVGLGHPRLYVQIPCGKYMSWGDDASVVAIAEILDGKLDPE